MFSCLLVGPPGSGKTTAASTAPGKKLFIDFDNKLHKMENVQAKIASGEIIQVAINDPLSNIGLRRLATNKLDIGSKQVVVQPKGYLHFVEIMDALEKECKWNDQQIDTVVVDSYTALQEHLKRMIMAANDKMSMTLPLYGPFLANLEEVNNTLIRLKANVIVICHQKLEKDELTGKVQYHPLIEGQMADKIGKDFEEVYYMQKVISGTGPTATAKYEMLTLGDNMRDCRTSRTLPALVKPDFCEIYGIKKA